MSKNKPITLEQAKKIDDRLAKDHNVNPKVNLGKILSEMPKNITKKIKKPK